MSRLYENIGYYEDGAWIEHDVAYARERCRLDVYSPDAGKLLPIVVYFHGGGMTGGEKSIPEDLLDSGLVVVGVNYRLSGPRACCPDYLNDAAAAVGWVFRHGGEYGGDVTRMTLTGVSAGGYLAAMLGMDGRWLGQFGHEVNELMLVAPISGQMTTHFQILNERYGTHQNIPEHPVIDEYAPLWHASAALPPIALYTGDVDLDWPGRPQENLLLASMLTRIKGHAHASCTCIPGFAHCDVGRPAMMLVRKRVLSMTT